MNKKIFQILILFVISLLLVMEKVFGQINTQNVYQKVTIENTHLFTITSKNIPDQIFQIKIDLPDSYSYSDSTVYPVLFLTDADYLFGIATDMVDYLRWGGFIPEIIIVGIAYGTKDGQNGNMRSRDFKPYPNKDGIIGAQLFLKFMTEELYPMISSNYRINEKDKTLFGYSYGGSFAVYTLFTNPGFFEKYVINSPSLQEGDNWAVRKEEDYYEREKSLPVKVYMSIGETEFLYPPFPHFIETIKSRNYRGLDLKEEVISKGKHFSVIADALTKGLINIYSTD